MDRACRRRCARPTAGLMRRRASRPRVKARWRSLLRDEEQAPADARRSASEIGRFVGLSSPAAKRRIDRLEEGGVIRGYTLKVNQTQLGEHIEAFIELRFAPGTWLARVDGAVTELPESIDRSRSPAIPMRSRTCACETSSTSKASSTGSEVGAGRSNVITTRTVIVLGRTEPAF
jgi:AsnC-type helix-turn-helix domain